MGFDLFNKDRLACISSKTYLPFSFNLVLTVFIFDSPSTVNSTTVKKSGYFQTRVHIIVVFVVLESTHFHSKVFTLKVRTKRGAR